MNTHRYTKRIALLILFYAGFANAVPLDTIGTFCGLYPDQCRKGTTSLLAARGTGTNAYYVLEVDPTTGAIPVEAELDTTGLATSAKQDAQTALLTTMDSSLNDIETAVEGTLAVSAASLPSPVGRAYADSAFYAYSGGSVTSGAWVEIDSSTAATINCVIIDETGGQWLELGTGAAAAEARKLLVPPGGFEQCIPLAIASGTRLSIRAIDTATGTVGAFGLTGLN